MSTQQGVLSGSRESARGSEAGGQSTRRDLVMLWAGIGVSLAFTVAIWALGSRLASIPHHPDFGASWYYWRLMEPSTAARVTAWGGYLLHQISIWALIYAAQRMRPKYGTSLHWFNWAAIGVNGLFSVLHIIQTHVWYGGLAEDVSIWSSQWSVIIMLVLIVLMENQRRGIVLGQKVGFLKQAASFTRQYHGYIFAWGVIYTFWYHPTESTFGHLLGFFYTFLLMLQGSMFFTRVHLNKWWGASLETLVLIHGTMVAVAQGNGMWPMFGFGFAGVFVLTIVHGLAVSRWVRWGSIGLYIALALFVYGRTNIANIHQITWIPVTYYVSVFVFGGLISLGLYIYSRSAGRSSSNPPAAA